MVRDNAKTRTDRNATIDSLNALRAVLPDAEFILSTWADENTEGLSGYKTIRQTKPEPFHDLNGNTNNINLQLLSTIAGLKQATRPYILKLRSDLGMFDSRFCQLADWPNHVPVEKRLFTAPVNATNIFTRDPTVTLMLFHLSDMAHFGRCEDINDLWSQPLFDKGMIMQPGGPVKNPFGNYAGYTSMRVVPEQALTLAWLAKHDNGLDITRVCDINREKLDYWEEVLFANFNIMAWQNSGLSFPERFTRSRYTEKLIYNAATIEQLRRPVDKKARQKRFRRAMISKYLAFPFRLTWYISTGSILLFAFSSSMALKARAFWRRLIGWDKV